MMRLRVEILGALFVCANGAGLRIGSSSFECPLCVAEDNCHEACAQQRQVEPGSMYCLTACNGAHPGNVFDSTFFEAADAKIHEREQLDASMKKIGQELMDDLKKGNE